MRKIVKISITLVLLNSLIVLSGGMFISCSKSGDSISGTWILTYDPDSPEQVPDDRMVFKKNGEVDLSTSTEVYITCPYEEKEDKVTVRCIVKGNEKVMDMKFSDDRNDLINPSGAYYTKQ